MIDAYYIIVSVLLVLIFYLTLGYMVINHGHETGN